MPNYMTYKSGAIVYGIDVTNRIFARGNNDEWVTNPTEVLGGATPIFIDYNDYTVVNSTNAIPKPQLWKWRWNGSDFQTLTIPKQNAWTAAEAAAGQLVTDRKAAYQLQKDTFVAATDFSALTALQKEIVAGKKFKQVSEAEWATLGL